MMKSRAKRSDSRTFVGAGLLIVAYTGLFVGFAKLFAATVPPVTATPVRLWVVLLASAALLFGASAVLGDRSILWQAPLRSVAVAALLVGIRFPIEALFRNPSWFASIGVLVCGGYLLLGGVTGLLMQYVQKRLLRKTHAA